LFTLAKIDLIVHLSV